MSTTTETIPTEHSTPRLQINRIGLWLFFVSESMLFLGLFAIRFSLVGTDVHPKLSQLIGLIITVLLLASSYTAFRAERAAHAGDQAETMHYLRLTLMLGTVFLAGVAYEWFLAFEKFPPDTEFGTVFFTMTGMHAFHVITGLIFLGIIYRQARRGAYAEDSWPVEAGVKYWHFVDIVWVFLYPVLYLL